jgi:hypothetical protein
MLDGVDDLALIFVASQWPFLLFTFFAIAFSALKVRRLDKNSHSSSTNVCGFYFYQN